MEEILSQTDDCQERTSGFLNANKKLNKIFSFDRKIKVSYNKNEKFEKSMCSKKAQTKQKKNNVKIAANVLQCTNTTTTTTRTTFSTVLVFNLFVVTFLTCFEFGNCAVVIDVTSASTSDVIFQKQQLNANYVFDDVGKINDLQAAIDDTENELIEIPRHRVLRAVSNVKLFGYTIEDPPHTIEWNNGVPSILTNSEHTIRLYGENLADDTQLTFTEEEKEFGGSCMLPVVALIKPVPGSATGSSALYKVTLPISKGKKYYMCTRKDAPGELLEHKGKDDGITISSYENLLPIWASIVIIITCLCFSALFSGLNLGLMSLDRTELKILCNTGTKNERKYAKVIQPVRDKGNYLLCSILLGNVLVNSIFTILLDGLTSGLFAVIFSTMAIVIFGEITPQAVCSRHGLAVGAKTVYITKVVMAITFPISYPVSRMLDFLLGEELGNVYNRERLKELVKVTNDVNDLDKNEVNIISGALELRKKTVADVMTHIDDVFMLSLDAVLDFETVSEIMKSGYSRVPVFDGDRTNIVTLLYIKDLAFVDTDDNTPLKTLCEFYQNPVHFVFEDYTLDVMFNQFKDGTFGHLAFVHRVNNEGDGDPFYETIGLVTLEDVIEELIQAEIVDETDVFVDNRTKQKRVRNKKQDFTAFAERRDIQGVHISPQLALATYQYLSTSIDPFKKEVMSEQILRRLLNQNVVFTIKCKGKEKDDPSLYIFTQGKAVDFFVLILEGRVEVTIGRESLVFESGPFTYFGTQALAPILESPSQIRGSIQSLNIDSKVRQTFIPDYSVRAASDVIYIAIKRNLYLTAMKATLLDKTRKSGVEPGNDMIDDEVEKLLHSLNEDEKRYTRSSRKGNTSHTASPSMNDNSSQNRKIVTSASQYNTQANNNNSDNTSLSSNLQGQISDMADVDLSGSEHNIDKENNTATTPLLPKPPNNNNDDDDDDDDDVDNDGDGKNKQSQKK